MSIRVDETGRRFVQVEAEVPGTPEQVWQAISTGPGVSSWFVPCTIEGRVGGKIALSFGPGMESSAIVTGWEPPVRFTAESTGQQPGAPTVADEWVVEAQAGGTCIVRVVHSWFAETDDWDSQYEGTESGWRAFFRDLRLYLAHFNGQESTTLQLMGFSEASLPEAWAQLCSALGLTGSEVGDQVHAPAGSPSVSGRVEWVSTGDHPEHLLLLSEPGPGVGHFFGMQMGGMTCLSMRLFFFGDSAAPSLAEAEPSWRAWVDEHFPMPATTVPTC